YHSLHKLPYFANAFFGLSLSIFLYNVNQKYKFLVMDCISALKCFNRFMQQTIPLISVIIPTFNRFKMLERALRSVLTQSLQNFEVILIDDASTDGTDEYLQKRFSAEIEKGIILYTRNKNNKGRSVCRNIGIKLSNAEFIAFLDDDDEWLVDHLANLYNLLSKHKDLGIAFSNWYTVNEETKKILPGIKGVSTGTGNFYLGLMLRALIGYPSTGMVRSSLIKKIGGFKEELILREDWELFSKCALASDIGFIDKPTAYIYVHAGSYSKNKVQWVKDTELSWNSILDFAKQHRVQIDNRFIAERSLRLSRGFLSVGDFDKAKAYLLNAIKYNPISIFNSITMENTFKLLIGKQFYLWYKSHKG
ncbi:MAG: glycosyltransferase family 2 protein, partial [bacterium]